MKLYHFILIPLLTGLMLIIANAEPSRLGVAESQHLNNACEDIAMETEKMSYIMKQYPQRSKSYAYIPKSLVDVNERAYYMHLYGLAQKYDADVYIKAYNHCEKEMIHFYTNIWR